MQNPLEENPTMSNPELETAGTPAAPDSRLASLRERREQALKALHIDLPVPRLDPPVYVRYGAVTQAQINAANKQFEKSKDRDRDVLTNATVLGHACQGVYEEVDGEIVSIDPEDRHGDAPRFDERLAELLGIQSNRASDVIRALYVTDGDIIATGAKVAEFYGYTMENIEERQQGF